MWERLSGGPTSSAKKKHDMGDGMESHAIAVVEGELEGD
jgi:hypothetical protein